MKKAIKYLRFSSDDQSQHSIERQEIIISAWAKYNHTEFIDSFEDKGYSARTFDRPDMKALFDFIRKNHREINYLVVSELTRFSRDAGDAINMVKKIQSTYNIKIVSANRSIIYDCSDSNSFFMMGLEFLLGNSENIKRTSDINGGIYTAKAEKGKWIQGGKTPTFGYLRTGSGKDRKITVNEAQAVIIRFIFNAYLNGMPFYRIKQEAEAMGRIPHKNDVIQSVLRNPLYMSFQYVKPWQEQPGGLFPIKDLPPIIAPGTWYAVQERLNYKPKVRATLDDNIPLRGVLKCHCGKMLTGAPSRGKMGKYYYYYKCTTAHNNISAAKAHTQLNEILQYLSIPEYVAREVKHKSETVLESRRRDAKKLITTKRNDLDRIQEQISSLEEKWINNQIQFETYNRWFGDLNSKRVKISSQIDSLSRDENQLHLLLQSNIHLLTDLQYVYKIAATSEKQELLRQVFDKSLSYGFGSYRTQYLMPIFRHNQLILKQKQLLIIDGFPKETPQVELQELLSNSFFDLMAFVQSIRVA